MQIHVAKTTAQMAVDNLDRSGNYDDPVLAEIYDQCEIGTEDVELLRRLLRGYGPLNILECFSGTGRILIPLACDGHGITGIEIAEAMNARAASKLAALAGRELPLRAGLRGGAGGMHPARFGGPPSRRPRLCGQRGCGRRGPLGRGHGLDSPAGHHSRGHVCEVVGPGCGR